MSTAVMETGKAKGILKLLRSQVIKITMREALTHGRNNLERVYIPILE